jgi:hypothetical protein
MLIVALVLAVIGLAALVTAVVTSNELIAWVCIGASVIGVLLLIVDALRERSRGTDAESAADDRDDRDERDDETTIIPAVGPEAAEDYPDEPLSASDVLTPDVAPQEQAFDPADDDSLPGTKHD